MNTRLEIVNALLSLSNQCAYVAKLLSSDTLSEIQMETPIYELPDTSEVIDVRQFELWPEAVKQTNMNWEVMAKQQAHSIGFDLSNSRILEYSNGPSIPIGHVFKDTKVDLICNCYKFGSDNHPQSIKIIDSFEEADKPYDIGIVYESLEFDQDPIMTLLKMKQCVKLGGKIFVRFRPWSSRDGGFQSDHYNKAFMHLLIDLESNQQIKNKVIRPISKYESIINAAKLQVISRKVRSIPPDDYIIFNDEYMNVLIKRTWGSIKKEEAIKIMATTSVDFLVSVC